MRHHGSKIYLDKQTNEQTKECGGRTHRKHTIKLIIDNVCCLARDVSHHNLLKVGMPYIYYANFAK